MTRLTVHHRTRYRFRRPVALRPHRLMIGRATGTICASSRFAHPHADGCRVRWAYDVFGSSIATATPLGPADVLRVDGRHSDRPFPDPEPSRGITDAARTYPFRYDRTLPPTSARCASLSRSNGPSPPGPSTSSARGRRRRRWRSPISMPGSRPGCSISRATRRARRTRSDARSPGWGSMPRSGGPDGRARAQPGVQRADRLRLRRADLRFLAEPCLGRIFVPGRVGSPMIR